jgi:hypothetical protein
VEALIGIAGVVLGALAGTIATYLTTRSKMRWELVYAYDRELRDKRLPHYQKLFHLSGAVPREWRPGTVPSRAELWQIRQQFHDWYFGTDAGGMFLTRPPATATSPCRTGCRRPPRARARPVPAGMGSRWPPASRPPSISWPARCATSCPPMWAPHSHRGWTGLGTARAHAGPAIPGGRWTVPGRPRLIASRRSLGEGRDHYGG